MNKYSGTRVRSGQEKAIEMNGKETEKYGTRSRTVLVIEAHANRTQIKR